jgi:hypothetical protein
MFGVVLMGRVRKPRKSSTDNRSRLILLIAPYLIALLVISGAYFILRGSQIATLLGFVALLIIFLYFKFDSKILFGYGAVLLVVAGIALAYTGNLKSANQFAVYSYWLLGIGILCLIIGKAIRR